MKRKTISKFMGIASLCCFSAVSLQASQTAFSGPVPNVTSDSPEGAPVEIAQKIIPLNKGKTIFEQVDVTDGPNIWTRPLTLNAKNATDLLLIAAAPGSILPKIQSALPEFAVSKAIANKLNPRLIVTKGRLAIDSSVNIVDLPFIVRADNLRDVRNNPAKIFERIAVIDGILTKQNSSTPDIKSLGSYMVLGANSQASFSNFTNTPYVLKSSAGVLSVNDVNISDGLVLFKSALGNVSDFSGVGISYKARTKYELLGMNTRVTFKDDTNLFSPVEVATVAKIKVKGYNQFNFTDNTDLVSQMAPGAAAIVLHHINNSGSSNNPNLLGIAASTNKLAKLGILSVEMPNNRKDIPVKFLVLNNGSGDLSLTGLNLRDDETVHDRISAAYASQAETAGQNFRPMVFGRKPTEIEVENLQMLYFKTSFLKAVQEANSSPRKEVAFAGNWIGDISAPLVVQRMGSSASDDSSSFLSVGSFIEKRALLEAVNTSPIGVQPLLRFRLKNGALLQAANDVSVKHEVQLYMDPGSTLDASNSTAYLAGGTIATGSTMIADKLGIGSKNIASALSGVLLVASNVRVTPLSKMSVQDSTSVTGDLNIAEQAWLGSRLSGSSLTALASAQSLSLGAAQQTFTAAQVLGDTTLSNSAVLAVEAAADGSSDGFDLQKLIIGENVSAALVPSPSKGVFSRKQKTAVLLKSTNVVGEFEGVFPTSDLLKVNLVRENAPGFTTYSIDFQRLSLPNVPLLAAVLPNKLLVAMDAVLDKAADQPAFAKKLAAFKFLSSADILDVAEGLQKPGQLKALAMSQENNAVNVRNTLSIRFQRELDAMHCATSKDPSEKCDFKVKPVHVWATGFGDNMYQGKVAEYGYGFQNNMGGFSAGVDYHFADVLYAGALGAYTSSDINWLYGNGSGDITTGYAGLYMSAISKMYWGTVAVLGGWSDYSSNANVQIQNNMLKFSNSHNGSQILTHADTGINFGFKGFTIRPFDSFDYISQSENSFKLKNNGFLNLEVEDQTSIMIRNELGINFAGCYCIKGMQWTISPKISWVREVRVKGKSVNVKLEDVDQSFAVNGYFPNRSLVSPGVTLSGNFMDDLFTVDLYYNGEFQGNYSDHQYGGQIRFGF